MGAMKGVKSIPKTEIAEKIAGETGLTKPECSKLLDALAGISAKEVKKTGKFTIPGVCMVKTKMKKATKAGKREMFGKIVKVKAMKARTIVKAFPVAALKKVV